MKKTILFFISLFILNNLYSQDQKADLIFNDGDILEGYGMITSSDKIKFRISKDDKPDKWDYSMIKGIIFYGFNTIKEFEYIKVNKKQKPVLLELVSSGKVNLYKENLNYSTTFFNGNIPQLIQHRSRILYVKRNSEEIATNLAGRFKKKSLEYFKDCLEVIDIFSSKEYLKYSIEEIVDEYNIYCSD